MKLTEAIAQMNEAGGNKQVNSYAMSLVTDLQNILKAHDNYNKTKSKLTDSLTKYLKANHPETLKKPSVESDILKFIGSMNFNLSTAEHSARTSVDSARKLVKELKRI